MAVEPVSIAGAAANVTLAMPVVTDGLTTMANFLVQNYIGVLIICMAVVRFAAGIILGMVKGRGRRR